MRLASVILASVLACSAMNLVAQEVTGSVSPTASPTDPVDRLDLFAASKLGDLNAMKASINDGVDLDGLDPRYGVTSLSWAAAMGHVDAVDLLLDEGADVNARNGDGVTALHAACFFGQPGTTARLLDRGAVIHAETNEGDRPIDVLKANWETTRELAGVLEIEVEQQRINAGRAQVAELLNARGGQEGGSALFVLSIVFGCIFGGLSIVGLVLWLVHQHEKKRTESLRVVAADIDMSFSATQDDALLAKLQGFSLFNKGHGRKMRNVMTAETDLAQLTVFDYQFTTGGGNSSRTHHHTVVAMESESLLLPEFTLRPEGFFDRVGATLGFQDIDFDEHPEFSRLFVLQGKDEEAIRHFFDTSMLQRFSKLPETTINSVDGLFIFLRGGRKKPEEFESFIAEGYDVFRAFEQRLHGA